MEGGQRLNQDTRREIDLALKEALRGFENLFERLVRLEERLVALIEREKEDRADFALLSARVKVLEDKETKAESFVGPARKIWWIILGAVIVGAIEFFFRVLV